MNCIDEHVMKQLYVDIDKATKNLYSNEQIQQIIENLVENRVKQHLISMAHELLFNDFGDRVRIILKAVINELDLQAVVRHKAITYFHSSDFEERLKSILEYSDVHYLDKEITLKDIQDALLAKNY